MLPHLYDPTGGDEDYNFVGEQMSPIRTGLRRSPERLDNRNMIP
jgi:hypothetical protein